MRAHSEQAGGIRVSARIGIILAVALLGSLAWRPTLRALGTFLVVDDALGQAEAVVVLSGDVDGKRLDSAITLVQRGITGWIIVLMDTAQDAPDPAPTIRQYAALRGVDVGHVIIVRDAHSTADDARLAAETMTAHGWGTALVVTSSYHTRRASGMFRRIWGPMNLSFSVHPSQDSGFDPQHWWQDGHSVRAAMLEYLKLAVYLVRYSRFS